jgi:hypothetical protein
MFANELISKHKATAAGCGWYHENNCVINPIFVHTEVVSSYVLTPLTQQ